MSSISRLTSNLVALWSPSIPKSSSHEQQQSPPMHPFNGSRLAPDQSPHSHVQQGLDLRTGLVQLAEPAQFANQLQAELREARQMNDQLRQTIAVLHHDNGTLHKENLKLHQEHEKLEQENEKLEQELMTQTGNAKRRIEEYKREHRSVNSHCREMEKTLAAKSESLKKALQELEATRQETKHRNLANSQKVSDSTIQGKWKQLDYSIRSLAYALSGFSELGELNDHVIERLKKIKVTYLPVLSNKDERDFILQGYLWVLVDQQIFQGGGQAWAGIHGFYMKAIEDTMLDRVENQEFSHALPLAATWTSQGRTLMDLLWENDPEILKTLLSQETEYLKPFIAAHTKDHDVALTKTSVKDALAEIFTAALELDQMLMASKAIFFIRWKFSAKRTTRPRYDDRFMEALAWEKDLSSSSLVKLFISPALIKTGNADGENYDSQMIVAKASVVCN